MRAELRVQAGDSAGLLARALAPEAETDLSRAAAELAVEDGCLVVTIRAEDPVALRAALNSYMRWLKLAMDSEGALAPRE